MRRRRLLLLMILLLAGAYFLRDQVGNLARETGRGLRAAALRALEDPGDLHQRIGELEARLESLAESHRREMELVRREGLAQLEALRKQHQRELDLLHERLRREQDALKRLYE